MRISATKRSAAFGRWMMPLLWVIAFSGAMSAQSLLIDVAVSNTTPGPSDVFTYKIRYRCASITQHCFNAHITYTIPDALDVISAPSVGGNVSSVTVTGNLVDIYVVSPASAGAPAGALAAGSSGILTTQVRFKCGTNGVPPIGAAGSPVNFTMAGLPTFTATGAPTAVAAPPANVTTPTVNSCPSSPTPPGPTDLQKKPEPGTYGTITVGGSLTAGQNSYVSLEIPAHASSFTITDIFPAGLYPYELLLTSLTDFGMPGGATLEVYSNGSWYNVTSSVHTLGNTLGAWINSVPVGSPLLADGGVNTGSVREEKTYANGSKTSWGSNLIGIRVTTGSAGSGAVVLYPSYHVHDNTPPGTLTNCMTSNNPGWTTACTNLVVAPDKPNAFNYSLGDFAYWPSGGNLGTSSFTLDGNDIYYPSSFPLVKQPEDVVWGTRVEISRSSEVDLNGFIVEDLLPVGWDFVTTGDSPNWWAVSINGDPLLSPTCETPVFTRIPNYNGTGRTFLRWEFPTCVLPKSHNNGINTGGSVVTLGLTSRWMATSPLPASVLNNFVLKAYNGQQLARWHAYAPSSATAWTCEDYVESSATWTFPTSGSNTDSWKYVKGALDSDFSRYPDVGNTNLNGNGVYELHIKNTGFVPVKQLDVADILPYIGDKDLTTGAARNSQWSEELVNAITLERYKIGTGWQTVAMGELPLSIMYASTYNSCYLDAPVPTGQIDADPAQANNGQSAGCTDFSAANPASGAKGFSFRWLNAGDPLTFGEELRISVDIRQLTGEADFTNGEIAWNSFAYTPTLTDNTELFSSEPIKVGLKMIDPATTAAIGDYVWIDGNGNGRQDAGETPVEGVEVSLYDASGNPVLVTPGVPRTTHTDVNGYYCFPGLTPSTNYHVRLQDAGDFTNGGPLVGYSLTTANAAGVPDDVDSDASMGTLAGSPVTPRPQIVSPTLGAGTQTKTYDFGFTCLGTISGSVWMDTDNGGDQTAGEMALSGVTVTLKDATTNAAVGSAQMTNPAGTFTFTNVMPGTYYVEFSGFPGGKIPTYKDLTGDDNTDSDVNSNGRTDNFVLNACDFVDVDLGLRNPPANPATICGKAWDDLNKNGSKDGGAEPGMPNVTVQLLDVNGFVINIIQTDANGNYCFTNLDPNVSYKVAFVPPAVGVMFSVAGSDQDVDLMTGVTTATYTPTNNQTINDVDAGFMGPLSIGNLVWLDANYNGTHESNEAIFTNTPVRLIASNGSTVLMTTMTDANGRYVFKLLNAGTYYVEVQVPAPYNSSTDIGTSGTPNAADNDDNGAGSPSGGYIRSAAIILANDGGTAGSANWTESDHGVMIMGMTDPASNPKAYYTVDFGFNETPSCVAPSGITFSQTAATCTGASSNNNGTISLSAATNGTHYGISTLNAGSYNGPAFASATAIPGALPAVVQSSIPNTGGTYIVRIFNGANDCYTDQTVTVVPVGCSCPPIPCGTTTVTKN